VDDLSVSLLLKRHAELEALYDDGNNGNFLSGWQCENPWVASIHDGVKAERGTIDAGKYVYLEDDLNLRERFVAFHLNIDGVAPEALLFGEGSTSLLFSLCAWLRERGIEEVFYIPPLYFTLHYALRLLGFQARPVAAKHAFEEGFTVNLPPKRCVLLFSDPVWYAGMSLHRDFVMRIDSWQRRTQSLVIVDGSFQYMNWCGLQMESTALLTSRSTVRIICPTKALAAHGYRFAYAVAPADLGPEITSVYSRVYGSASADSLAFGRFAATAMGLGDITRSLMSFVKDRHTRLRQNRRIDAPWCPDSGYFVFERVLAPIDSKSAMMDGSYFDQPRYKDHRRINLLSPSISRLE